MESIIVGAIILGAAFWFVRWLRSSAKGEGGCGCGKCAKGCASRSDDCLRGREG